MRKCITQSKESGIPGRLIMLLWVTLHKTVKRAVQMEHGELFKIKTREMKS